MNVLSVTLTLIYFLLIFHPTQGKTWRTRSSSKSSSFETLTSSTAAALSTSSTTTVPTSTTATSYWQRSARYARYDPPKIVPANDFQTVKAGTTYTFRCEGNGRGVSWRLPNTTSDDLIRRISLDYSENGHQNYVTELTIKQILYSDTGTFTCTYNGTLDLTSIDNSSSVHLYVDDGVHLLKQSSYEFFVATQGSAFNLPCMPTLPDVNVTLWRETTTTKQILPDKYVSFNPKTGFNISPVVMNLHSGDFTCKANFRGREEIFMSSLNVLKETTFVPMPIINQTLARHIRKGDQLTLACSVTIDFNVMVELTWKIPNLAAIKENRVDSPDTVARNLSIAPGINYKQVEQSLTIMKSTKDDQGLYECTVVDHSGNTKTKTEFIRVLEQEESYIRIYYDAYQMLDITLGQDEKPVQWVVQIEAHPQPTIEWYDPNGLKIDPIIDQDFEIQTQMGRKAQTMLRIKKMGLSKAGNYMVKVFSNSMEKTENFTLIVRSKPKVQISAVNSQDLYQMGMEHTLKCSAKAFPVPEITWMFSTCTRFDQCDPQKKILVSRQNKRIATYGRESELKVVAAKSGRFYCQACNDIGCNFDTLSFFVTDVNNNGFAVEGAHKVMAGEKLKIKCSASIYNFSQNSIEWYKDTLQGPVLLKTNENFYHKVTTYSTELSFGKELSFENVSLVDKGRYICRVEEKLSPYHNQPESFQEKRAYDYIEGQKYVHPAYSVKSQTNFRELSFDVLVLPLEPPELIETNLSGDEIILVEEPSKGLMLKCRTGGRPRPIVKWFLHGSPIQILPNTTRVQILEAGEVLQINYVMPEDEGLYECRAENSAGNTRAAKIVQLLESAQKDALYANISLPVLVVVGIALCLVLILVGLAKWFYHRRASWKKPLRPQTPRLTQYELPQNQEDDDCRMTLTSSITRDGSISPNELGHYGNHLMTMGGPCQDPCHCHAHVHQACHLGPSVLVPQCSICEYSMQTLPLNRMNTIGSKHTLRRYDPHRSRSHSPRLSAEF